MNAAVLLAAGSGRRMQGATNDKVLVHLADKPALLYSIEAFLESGCISHFCIVVRDPDQQEAIEQIIRSLELSAVSVDYTFGGIERQNSVYNALSSLPETCTNVFIHDCARPLVKPQAIRELHKSVLKDSAAVLAHPVVDTIKRIERADTLEQVKLEDLDRSRLWAMETPQAFAYADILKAYQHVIEASLSITDDTAAAALIGLKASIVINNHPNPKLTTAKDMAYIEWLLKSR
ncbi:MAG: IspD/TarI family cytidylyltransferase [Coraliomargarita sp.]